MRRDTAPSASDQANEQSRVGKEAAKQALADDERKTQQLIAIAEAEAQLLYELNPDQIWAWPLLFVLTISLLPVLLVALYLNAVAIASVIVPCTLLCTVVLLPALKIQLALGRRCAWWTRSYVCLVVQLISSWALAACVHTTFDIVAGTVASQVGETTGRTSIASYYLQSICALGYLWIVGATFYGACAVSPGLVAIPRYVDNPTSAAKGQTT